MVNPMAMAMARLTPQQQQEMNQLKELGKRIKATIVLYGDHMEVTFKAKDQEAGQVLTRLSIASGAALAQCLHMMWNVVGEIVDRT